MKFKIFIMTFVFLFSLTFVNAVGDLGCCLVTTGNVYCQSLDIAENPDDCKNGMFDNSEDALITDSNGEKVCSQSAEVEGFGTCQIGCLIDEYGKGSNGVKHIKFSEEGGHDFVNSCNEDDRFSNEVGCLINEFECVWGWTSERCEIIEEGEVYRTLSGDLKNDEDCRKFTEDSRKNNMGCCVGTNSCSFTSGDLCDGEFDGDVESCTFVEDCLNLGCSNTERICEGNVGGNLYQRDSCGGQRLLDDCENDEYCTLDGCKPRACDLNDDGERETSPGNTWCEGPSENDNVGDVHIKWECVNGEAVPERCGLFRSEICVEDGGGANCELNKWSECEDRIPSNCESGDYLNHCKVVDQECLPRHPPGFRFWDCESFDDENCLNTDIWNDGDRIPGAFEEFMCSVETSKLGCELSGDCESIPMVDSEDGDRDSEEETPVENELPSDCVPIEDGDPIGCCIFSSIGGFGTKIEARTMKESFCTSSDEFEHVFFDGKVCFDSTEVNGIDSDGLEAHILKTYIGGYVEEPVNCEENFDIDGGDTYYAIRSDSYCSCDNQICFRGGGGVCKTS
jgi:hypothetical protein